MLQYIAWLFYSRLHLVFNVNYMQASSRCGRSSHDSPSSIFWQLWPSAWRCNVVHCAVLRHLDPDASVLMRLGPVSISRRSPPKVTSIYSSRRPPLMTSAPCIFVVSDWTNLSCWFPVTLPVLWRTVRCRHIVGVLNHPLVVLNSTLFGSLLQKPPPSAMPYADWINCRDVTRHGLASDAHSTQISFRNIHVSS